MTAVNRTPTYRGTFDINDTAGYEALKANIKLDKAKGEYLVKRFRGSRLGDYPADRRVTFFGRWNGQSMCLKKNATRFDVYVLTR